jgi:hypothetical protein
VAVAIYSCCTNNIQWCIWKSWSIYPFHRLGAEQNCRLINVLCTSLMCSEPQISSAVWYHCRLLSWQLTTVTWRCAGRERGKSTAEINEPCTVQSCCHVVSGAMIDYQTAASERPNTYNASTLIPVVLIFLFTKMGIWHHFQIYILMRSHILKNPNLVLFPEIESKHRSLMHSQAARGWIHAWF